MVTKKSSLHVAQPVGKNISTLEILGYYNDLTNKLDYDYPLNSYGVPITKMDDDTLIEFPIAIFQYGLANYEKYLETSNIEYFEQAKKCALWGVNNLDNDGGWDTFGYINNHLKYSSMAQSEGISLLIRINKLVESFEISEAIHRAYNKMITDINELGTMSIIGKDIVFYEYMYADLVLNGWIFTIFGIYDYYLYTKNDSVLDFFLKCFSSLENNIDRFNNGEWSLYSLDGKYASGFYHNLHIELIKALIVIKPSEKFSEVLEIFKMQSNNRILRCKAFLIKVYQKLVEK